MILHLATFSWTPEVTADDVAGLTAELEAMAAETPSLRRYLCGESLRLRPGADFGVVAIVDDVEGLEAYLDSAQHRAVYERWLGWMIETRQAAQLQLPAGGLAP